MDTDTLCFDCQVYDPDYGRQVFSQLCGPTVTYVSSGTTGEPKQYLMDWQTLYREYKYRNLSTSRYHILSLHSPQTYAGVSVLAYVRVEGHRLLIVNPTVLEQVRRAALVATYLALTPTQMKMLLIAQITGPWERIVLGGETTDQRLLTTLHELYPRAQLSHVYASSECGICFAVHDGLAGIPLATVKHGLDGKWGWWTEHGELVITRPDGTMHQTGDFFTVQNDRAYFKGRLEHLVPVGGVTVSTVRVKEVLEKVPGVQAARVIALPSPLTGAILRGEVVGLYQKQEMQSYLETYLPREAWPRIITSVTSIPQTPAGKESLCESSSLVPQGE